ncbi:hypothetical protein [Bradyrhizobium sp.]|uniref:hypothetical protein n=1 Tax=Bradyrhizobium sp. TaxID=376 RepID=UPI00403791E3
MPALAYAGAIGSAARAAVIGAAQRRGVDKLPDAFHHSDNHSHAFWIAEDADEDGYIDHVVVFCEEGLTKQLVEILAAADRIFLGRLGEWQLIPNWMGGRSPGGLFGPSVIWRSMSAYVPPWWQSSRARAKPREAYSPKRQLETEIAARFATEYEQAPVPVRIVMSNVFSRGNLSLDPRAFIANLPKGQARRRRETGDAAAQGVEIEFDRPVWGPLAFGYGAHFGLGVFEPVVQE